jgi:hypothetical protein
MSSITDFPSEQSQVTELDTVNILQKRKTSEEKERQVCDFCGTPFSTIVSTMPDGQLARMLRRGRKNTKYCSEKCRDTATRRRSSARLGIRARAVSKFSSPLYFS